MILLIGPVLFIIPGAAQIEGDHQETFPHEMSVEYASASIAVNPKAGNQIPTGDDIQSEEIKTLLIILLSLIGISATCFLGNTLGKILEERIYFSTTKHEA